MNTLPLSPVGIQNSLQHPPPFSILPLQQQPCKTQVTQLTSMAEWKTLHILLPLVMHRCTGLELEHGDDNTTNFPVLLLAEH